ncbi:phosphotransferase enzyme family protein [Microlunatus parietis]|uniref:Ser/Thr protein kinase RdoA (MazF antagonist) n=1 Tax=Microlunatus parietis TaxID=682979 RepID=A0A7Y9I900_9ACTN|nr:phosphotransferase [Microlunatus parietis]NYE72455.1 Ser/Thr protein kinase RdoA (MazF antagonist) [Microlunatus parietis]
MTDLLCLRALIMDQYGLADPHISRLADDHPVFLMITGAERWVIRVGHDLDRYAAVLDALTRAGFPAPPVLLTRDGRPVVEFQKAAETLHVMIIGYVDGEPTPFRPEPLGRLGGTLGRLHREGTAAIVAAADPRPGLPVIDRAGMLPAGELRFGLSRLAAASGRGTAAERNEADRLAEACRAALDFGPGLTSVFLHGDAHPWNSLLAADGSVILIDWDSAGPGPAVIDLGFLAVSCATGGLAGPPAPPDPARLAAVAAGYRNEFTLTRTDLDALPFAVSFRVLVNATVGFGNFLIAGRHPLTEPSIRWSLDRLRAAPRIAADLRQLLETGT